MGKITKWISRWLNGILRSQNGCPASLKRFFCNIYVKMAKSGALKKQSCWKTARKCVATPCWEWELKRLRENRGILHPRFNSVPIKMSVFSGAIGNRRRGLKIAAQPSFLIGHGLEKGSSLKIERKFDQAQYLCIYLRSAAKMHCHRCLCSPNFKAFKSIKNDDSIACRK